MTTRMLINKNRYAGVTYTYQEGGYFNPQDLICQPFLSQLDNTTYYGFINSSTAGTMHVAFEIDKNQNGLKILKILPFVMPASIQDSQINSYGGKAYIAINRKHMIFYIVDTNRVVLLNLETGIIEQNIDFSTKSLISRAPYVFYDEEMGSLIYWRNNNIMKYTISTGSETSITATNIAAYNSYSASYNILHTGPLIVYDSQRKKVITRIDYGYGDSSGYYYTQANYKIASLSTSGTVTGTTEFHAQSTSYPISGYTPSFQSLGYAQLLTFDEKDGLISTTFTASIYANGNYNRTEAIFTVNLVNNASWSSLTDLNSWGSFSGSYIQSAPPSIRIVGKGSGVQACINLPTYRVITSNGANITEAATGYLTMGSENNPHNPPSVDMIPIYDGRSRDTADYWSSSISPTQDVRFAEIEQYGKYTLYGRSTSPYIINFHVAGGDSGIGVLYDISLIQTPSDLAYPASGTNSEAYTKAYQNQLRLGNPVNAKLRSDGITGNRVLYHDYYDCLDLDLYLWYSTDNKIRASIYYRSTDTVKTMTSICPYEPSTSVYDLGISRDGKYVVMVRHIMTSTPSVEYYLSNPDKTAFQTQFYSQTSFIPNSTKTSSPVYWNQPCHVLVTEPGVAGLSTLTTSATPSSPTNIFVHHRGINNQNMTRAEIAIDAGGNINPGACKVIGIISAATESYTRRAIIDGLYVENKNNQWAPVVFNTITGITGSQTLSKTVPVLTPGSPISREVVKIRSAQVNNGNVYGWTSYYNTPSPNYRFLKTIHFRHYYVTVNNIETFLYTDAIDGYSASVTASVSDVRISDLTYLDKASNYYILKGTIYSSNPDVNYVNPTRNQLNFVFIKNAIGTKLYIGHSIESAPIKVTTNKVKYTAISSLTNIDAYLYTSPPVQLTLDSTYPAKDTYYYPDAINYTIRILDEDKVGAALTSIKMNINGKEVLTKTTGLVTNTGIDIPLSVTNYYDDSTLKDGANTVQFKLDAGGDIMFLDISLYKGKMYRLDKAPKLTPSTVISKAHIKAFNGSDQLSEVSGVKTQSVTGNNEYVYHYKKNYLSSLNKLSLKLDGTKATDDVVQIKKIIATYEGGDL